MRIVARCLYSIRGVGGVPPFYPVQPALGSGWPGAVAATPGRLGFLMVAKAKTKKKATRKRSGNTEKQGKSRRKPPPKEHQFKPGQSGNPGGRPPGMSITSRLRRVLNADGGKVAEEVAAIIIQQAKRGRFQFVKELVDRIDGSVVQRVQIEDAINNLLVVAERVLDANSYGKLVFALAGGGDEGSDQDPTAEIRVH